MSNTKMMEKLYWNGSTGADLSPGDPVAAWAHQRILTLEGLLRKANSTLVRHGLDEMPRRGLDHET